MLMLNFGRCARRSFLALATNSFLFLRGLPHLSSSIRIAQIHSFFHLYLHPRTSYSNHFSRCCIAGIQTILRLRPRARIRRQENNIIEHISFMQTVQSSTMINLVAAGGSCKSTILVADPFDDPYSTHQLPDPLI